MSSPARPKESQLRHAFNVAQGRAAIAEKQQAIWDKSGLEEYRENLGWWRKWRDGRKIKSIFNMAAKAPALKEALDWASEHGVDFIIDRNMAALGMYHAGAGILSISDKVFTLDRKDLMVEALTHEIRHAWQDWNRMLPTYPKDFTGFYVQQSLMEADAYAHGFQAAHQYVAQSKAAKSGDDILRKGFDQWFTSNIADHYGTRTVFALSGALRIPFETRNELEKKVVAQSIVAPEFKPSRKQVMPNVKGITPDADGLALLGRGFKGGGNYFDREAKEKIIRDIFPPSKAMVFYKKGVKPHPAAKELRKFELKRRAEERKFYSRFPQTRKIPG